MPLFPSLTDSIFPLKHTPLSTLFSFSTCTSSLPFRAPSFHYNILPLSRTLRTPNTLNFSLPSLYPQNTLANSPLFLTHLTRLPLARTHPFSSLIKYTYNAHILPSLTTCYHFHTSYPSLKLQIIPSRLPQTLNSPSLHK